MTNRSVEVSSRLVQDSVPARLMISGEIDRDTVDLLDAALQDALEGVAQLVVDLTEVSYLGSLGIHSLFARGDRISSVAVREGSSVARALALTRFPRLTIVPAHR